MGRPEIAPGDDLSRQIVDARKKQGLVIREGDIFVVTHKIVSKSEARIISLDSIEPSGRPVQ